MKSAIFCVLAFTWMTAKADTPARPSGTTLQTADSLTTVSMKVRGITCATDVKMIAASVERLPGVSSCRPGKQGASSTFIITYNPYRVSENELAAAIENTGSCENPEERPYKVKR